MSVNTEIQPPTVDRESIPDTAPANTPRPIRLADLLDDLANDAERRHTAKIEGRPLGPVTPWPKVDAQYGGALPTGLHIILGGPGVGKTAFALQLAASCGCPALYITCEMSPLELLRRITARVTGTYLGRFRTGEYNRADVIEKARAAVESAPLLTLADATHAYPSSSWILETAETARGDHEHLLIVVDSLHSWAEASGVESNEYELVSAAAQALSGIGSRLDCPVVALSERNRASFAKGASKDKLHAGAGSRKLEYGAESVLSLEVDEDSISDVGGERPVTLTFTKNRNGSPGATVPLTFNGALQRFTESRL